MVSPKTVELINKEIDGLLTPAESKRLQEYLINDSEAANFHQEMKTMAQILTQVESVEPSKDLKKMIMNSIPKNKYRPQGALLETRSFIRRQVNFRLAFTFALGLFVGILTYSLVLSDGGIDRTDLLGTIRMKGAGKSFKAVDTWNLEGNQTRGVISTESNGDVVLLNIDLNTDRAIEVDIRYEESDLYFSGFHPDKYASGQITVTGSRLLVTSTGPNKFVMFFEDKTSVPSTFDINIITGTTTSKAVLQTTPPTNKKNHP